MTTITSSDIVREVRILASKNPDFIYRAPEGGSCQYVHRDDDGVRIKGAGCIVGQALARLGVIVRPELEGVSVRALLPNVVPHLSGISDVDSAWLDCVQIGQDVGERWGVAVHDADRSIVVMGGTH